MIRAFIIMALAGCALPALAQTPEYIRADSAAIRNSFGPAVAAKIFSDDYTPLRRDMVGKSLQRIPGFKCGKNPLIALAFVVPYPIKPGAVSWIERTIVDCQPQAQRNFLAIMEDNGPRMIELLPGSSMTDPVLQRDAFAGSSAAVVPAKPKNCDKQWVTDTKLAGEYKPNVPWVETWSYDLCGTKANVEMTFTPSATSGTTWSAKLQK